MEIFNFFILIIAILIVGYFLKKQYDTKVVLLSAGVFMAIISFNPMMALNAFADAMTTGGLIQVICSVIGFTEVMKITGCDKHLFNLLGDILKKTGIFLIPASTLLTFSINIALPSASGCAAAVGSILIPLLIHSGVKPVMAATAILLGTYGSVLSPGLASNILIAELANISVLEVINNHKIAVLFSILIASLTLGALAVYLEEHKGYVSDNESFKIDKKIKVNFLFASINLIPLFIIILGFSGLVPSLKMGVAQAMLLGVFIAVILTRSSPTVVSKKFFDGMGSAYSNILGIIIAATVFVSGLKSLGIEELFIDFMISNPSIAPIGGTLGPFFLAIVTGSGDVAALAFNQSLLPFSESFGMSIEDMGSLSAISGAIGRTMSPLAGAAIICAGFAKVSTLELAKRSSFGMVLALLCIYIILAI